MLCEPALILAASRRATRAKAVADGGALAAARSFDRRDDVAAWVDVVESRGLEDRVERGCNLGPTTRLRAEVILSAHDKSPFILPMSARQPSFTTDDIPSSVDRS